MLKLIIDRPLNYLSPSSCQMAIKQPNTFYLQRLCSNRRERDPQTKGAAVGSAFDVEVKKKIWSEGISSNSKHLLPKLLDSVEDKEFKIEAYRIGKKILRDYVMLAYSLTEFGEVEIWKQFNFHGLVLYVKLDATCKDGPTKIICPFDWKCMGFNPDVKSVISPKPKFYLKIEGQNICGGHKDYYHDMPMEEIDCGWAFQTCTYGWAIGLSPNLDTPFPVRIDSKTITKTGIQRTTCYRGIVTPSFQKYVLQQYKTVWNDLQSGKFMNRLASQYSTNLIYIASLSESWF